MGELISREEVVRRLREHVDKCGSQIVTTYGFDRAVMGDNGLYESETVLDRLADLIEGAPTKPDPDVTAFLNRLNEQVIADQPVTLWGREYLPASRAMELQLDADGVPIRIGDTVKWLISGGPTKVVGVGEDKFFYMINEMNPEWAEADGVRHVKQRTIADILREVDDTDGRDAESWVALITEAYEIGQRDAAR